MKKYLLVLSAIVIGLLFYQYSPYKSPPLRLDTQTSIVTEVASTTLTTPTKSQPTTQPTALATLKVGTTTYPLYATEGETLISAMTKIASTSNFTYTSRDYPSLGVFIDSINGTPSGNGKYWVFYVNGVSATQGVSTTLIKQGDLIEWKHENNY